MPVGAASAELRDLVVRRHLGTLRFSENAAKDFIGEIRAFDDQLSGRLMARLSRVYDRGPVTTKRLQDTLGYVREINAEAHAKAGSVLRGWLTDFSKSEVTGTVNAMRVGLPHLDAVGIARPDLRTVAARVLAKPWEGFTVDQHVSKLAIQRMQRIEKTVRVGTTFGLPMEEINRQVAGRFGVLALSRREQRTLCKTAFAHTANQSREELWAANDDLVEGVQWVSTLDSRTTFICMDYDGQVFKVGEGPRPPAHFNCRSVTVPVLVSWEKLGIPRDKIPREFRAAMDGKVPSKLTYDDWLRRQPANVQNAALGPGRAKLYRANESMTVHDLTGTGGIRPRSLKSLEQYFGTPITPPPAPKPKPSVVDLLQRGEITSSSIPPGDPTFNEVRILEIRDAASGRRTKGYWKAESPDLSKLNKGQREYFENVIGNSGGTMGNREILAAEIDEILGTKLVPRTVERELNGVRGTIQLSAPGSSTELQVAARGGGLTARQHNDLFFFDVIIGNVDRHVGNGLFDAATGRLTAIDHGFSFADGKISPFRWVRHDILPGGWWNSNPLSSAERARWLRLLQDERLTSAVQNSAIGEGAKKAALERIRILRQALSDESFKTFDVIDLNMLWQG